MTAMVGLLRGVNVGGKNKLPMADLRDIADACGFEQVRTYLQSGNVVFESGDVAHDDVAGMLERGINDRTGLSVPVIVRTGQQMHAVLEGNPFLDRSDDPTHHHVLFTAGDVESLGGFDSGSYAPEALHAVAREIFFFCPNGLGRSKLATDLTRRNPGAGGTMRNWRSVTALAAMAAATT